MEESLLQFDVLADHGDSSILLAQARTGVILPVLDWNAVEPEAGAVVEPPAARASLSG